MACLISHKAASAAMAKTGKVYENMMINLRPTNVKLRARMIRIVEEITGVCPELAEELLEQNGFVISRAVTAYKGKEESHA